MSKTFKRNYFTGDYAEDCSKGMNCKRSKGHKKRKQPKRSFFEQREDNDSKGAKDDYVCRLC